MKRISRRNFLKAMGISATALTLAACGGSSSSTAAGTAGSTAASAVATGEPKAGGTLRLCYSSPIATPGYTPRATGNAAIYYLTLSYESLTSYDAEGNMIPNLATEWDVNTDELSITWTLREGVNFADGEPFNAEAVKRNIEEYQANNRTETANIASCEVIDDTHIKMMMAEPNSSTLESVGFFVYYMSPKALENPSSLDAATCGTGPFQLSEFENNAYAIYTKNENYWKEGLPYLDSVEVTLVTESSTANTAFQANEYDMYWVGLANPTILQQLDGAGIYVKEDNQNGMGVESLGLIPNFATIAPDLGLYMGRHLDKNGAYYAKGIQHPDKEMELLEEIRRCMDPDEKHKLEKELQAAIYDAEDGSCLFGRVLYVNKSSMYKYDYVIDDHATEAFTACWDLSACWLNK